MRGHEGFRTAAAKSAEVTADVFSSFKVAKKLSAGSRRQEVDYLHSLHCRNARCILIGHKNEAVSCRHSRNTNDKQALRCRNISEAVCLNKITRHFSV